VADISKCHGNGCPVADRCYRFLAKTGKQQAWAVFDADREDGTPCPAFWDVSDDELQDNGFPLVDEKEEA